MRFPHFRSCSAAFAGLLLLVGPLSVESQDTGKEIKTSSFAPLKPTVAELTYFVDKIGKDLEDKADFTEDQQKRIGLDSSTVAVLALTLGMHDEKTELKAAASKIVDLAVELAGNAEEFDAAKKSYEQLKHAIETKPKGDELDWDAPVTDIVALMQQVPIVNDKVRRGVNDNRRFARTAEKTAQKAVTLAAIAHASMMNTDYCGDDEDVKAWKKSCADMRDACTDVYKALMEKDQEKAKAGNDRVVETCDACHHRFRD